MFDELRRIMHRKERREKLRDRLERIFFFDALEAELDLFSRSLSKC